MTGKISSATERALKLVAQGKSIAQAAAKAGVSRSTIYRAMERATAKKKTG